MQLELPLPGRPTTTQVADRETLRAETDSLRAVGAWAAQVQHGKVG